VEQICQLNNINPSTNEYSPTTIDLASEEPVVTIAPTTSTTEPTTKSDDTTTTESIETSN
jgi:hypothetical protein